ncbi:MAG: DNA-protecting protein DprA [Candidatus Omnitrophica bacterium]|nr:DNA-protecting protein DprA [Candidatus Omnitrophota bacterium]
MEDRERLILLNLVPDIGTIRVRRLLEAFGTLAALFAASEEQLQQVEGIGPVLAGRLASSRRKPELVDKELRLAQKAGCRVVTQMDAEFPAPLKQIPDPPLVLYLKGRWEDMDETAVAVVGARRASVYGQQTAQRLACELASRGATVVSGLARGIDGAAHRGALQGRGRTLAVLGNGLTRIYPPEHEELASQIAAHGAVCSEYPMMMEPLAQNFPRRNRLISGLSLGVVVVEAAQRSGALVTADMALEQGREVFAVPGKVDSLTSYGTHQLLKQGAKLVTCVDDILEELRLAPRMIRPTDSVQEPVRPTPPVKGVTADEQRVLEQLSVDEPSDVDTVAGKTGLAASTCVANLLGLELKRLVKQLAGKRFIKSG